MLIRELLRNELPSYMEPSKIFLMDALPLTSSGKADRQLLCKMFEYYLLLAKGQATAAATPDTSPTVAKIINAVHGVTGSSLRPTDRLLTSGLNSLNLKSFIDCLQSDFAKSGVTTAVLLQNPTVEALSALINKNKKPGQ